MLSKGDSRKKAGGVSGHGRLLSDIEAINKTFYSDKTLNRLASSTASSRAKSVGKPHVQETKLKPDDSRNSGKDSFDKDKKSSIWSWKGLKALTQVRNRRFNCFFTLQVHSIDGLPAVFDGSCLVVHWKRRDAEQITRPVKVCKGVAEFEDQLTHSCSVYGSRSGPHHSAKYEAKHSLLFVSAYDAPELDLGKHRVDLTRLLPITLEELEEEKSSGKWTTSFRLSGKARGATMNVSFGYVIENSKTELSCGKSVSEIPSLQRYSARTEKVLGPSDQMAEPDIYRAGSLPARLSVSNQSAEYVKDLHEILPMPRSELLESMSILYQKLDEEAPNTSIKNKMEADSLSPLIDPHKVDLSGPPDACKENCGTECEIAEFSFIDKGIEELSEEHVRPEGEILKIAPSTDDGLEPDFAIEVALDSANSLHPSQVEVSSQASEQSVQTCNYAKKEKDISLEEAPEQEMESPLSCITDLVNEQLESLNEETDALHLENYLEANYNYRDCKKGKSSSLDDVTDSVAAEFLEMLGINHSPFSMSSGSEPDSPRERMLRQFEKDALNNGGLLNFNIENDSVELASDIPMGSSWGTVSEDFHHPPIFEGFEEMSKIETDAFGARTRASKMEDLETEALMHEWGLNEMAFQHSPPPGSSAFGSPIHMPPDDPQQLPPLAEGLGSFVQTRDGGFLRSMDPALFRNAKSGGSLIMQVSNPVVVPAVMGSGVMDILKGLASIGIEKLSMQANKLMPLEDLTGKTVQQIAWEGELCLEGPERQESVHQESQVMNNVHHEKKNVKGTSPVQQSSKLDRDTEYVSLDDLAPLAMDKIEALSIEGLRIQSGMSDEDAPLNISAQSIGEFSALKGKTVDAGGSIALDGTCGLHLLDVKDNGEDVDGLMGLSLTLDEWMKLDSGEIDDDDLASERTTKILAAHHANSLDQFRGRSKGEKRRGRSRKYGLLGNNFTVALMVQLRDPLRDYEPVGTPMLALIQVERVFVPPKPRIYNTVPMSRISDDNDEDKTDKGAEKENIVEMPTENKINEEELIPQFKITEVHVAGLKAEQGKKKLWGSANQQQSGSRWLLANGMGKKNKHPLMKSKAVPKTSAPASAPTTTTVQPGETLWSISSRVHGSGAKWKELAALNPHIRNPNVILPNETLRLR